MISFVSMPAGPAGVPMAVPSGVARILAGGNTQHFPPIENVGISAWVESNIVTLEKVGGGATLTIIGGEYSKNGAAYSISTTTVKDGDTLRLRVMSSRISGTMTSAVATIGGLARTFTVTTAAANPVPTPTPSISIRAGAPEGTTIGSYAGTLGMLRFGDRPTANNGVPVRLLTVSGGNLLVGSDF